MSMINLLDKAYTKSRNFSNNFSSQQKINYYICNGRKPWSKGYFAYKYNFIKQVINDNYILKYFLENSPLPKQYGEFLDERVVEYPWFLSRVVRDKSRLLDAGSALNYDFILQHFNISQKEISIVTLEPEKNCYCHNKIGYLYNDLRNLPFRDNWFDEIVSISTIEHIGMDNSLYTRESKYKEKEKLDYLKVITEFKRITKPGGKVYITVPYGKYTDFGWYQQFNAGMINELIESFAPTKIIETYYCYEFGGWSVGNKKYCEKFDGFNIHDTKYFNPNSTKDYDPDYAACSRAIAALEMWK